MSSSGTLAASWTWGMRIFSMALEMTGRTPVTAMSFSPGSMTSSGLPGMRGMGELGHHARTLLCPSLGVHDTENLVCGLDLVIGLHEGGHSGVRVGLGERLGILVVHAGNLAHDDIPYVLGCLLIGPDGRDESGVVRLAISQALTVGHLGAKLTKGHNLAHVALVGGQKFIADVGQVLGRSALGGHAVLHALDGGIHGVHDFAGSGACRYAAPGARDGHALHGWRH